MLRQQIIFFFFFELIDCKNIYSNEATATSDASERERGRKKNATTLQQCNISFGLTCKTTYPTALNWRPKYFMIQRAEQTIILLIEILHGNDNSFDSHDRTLTSIKPILGILADMVFFSSLFVISSSSMWYHLEIQTNNWPDYSQFRIGQKQKKKALNYINEFFV